MNIFNLRWSWYEEEYNNLFMHPYKTNEMFDQDVKNLFRYSVDAYLKQEESWAGLSGLTEFIAKQMTDFGYIVVEPHTFGTWGAFILKRRDVNEDMTELLGEENVEKMFAHNDKIQQSLDKELEEYIRRLTKRKRNEG